MTDPASHRLQPEDYFRELRHEEIFPDPTRPFEVDLGCGDGSFLQALAAHHPERDFLGVERLMGRVRKVCRKAARNELSNLKVLRLETAYTLGYLLPTASVTRAHLLCPDPWPKKKHNKNRLFRNKEFQDGLARILKDNGEFCFKTDHDEYYEEALEVFAALPFLERLDWKEDAFFYPQTDFEQQWLAEGKSINRARYLRVPRES